MGRAASGSIHEITAGPADRLPPELRVSARFQLVQVNVERFGDQARDGEPLALCCGAEPVGQVLHAGKPEPHDPDGAPPRRPHGRPRRRFV